MNILLVHNFYQQFGGEDAAALAEKSLLEERGNRVIFFSRHNDEIKNLDLNAKVALGVQTISSGRTKRNLAELIRGIPCDVAFLHNIFPLISPSIYDALYTIGVPVVQVVHDFRLLCPNGWFYTRGQVCERCKTGNYLHAIRYRCYRDSFLLSGLYAASLCRTRILAWEKIGVFLCLTAFSKQKLLDAGLPADRIIVRPNFLDISGRMPYFEGGDFVLYLGRLSAEKGIWTLIHAFEQMPDIFLKIAGTGPLEESLRSYVAEKRLRNVEMVGFKNGDEKWKLLSDCLFTIVPSEWYETFGLVVLESYAAGKPVIGSRLGSLPFVIEEGRSGLLFEPGNVNDLVGKVRSLVDHPSLKSAMGRNGRTLVETQYSPEKGYQSLMETFEIARRR